MNYQEEIQKIVKIETELAEKVLNGFINKTIDEETVIVFINSSKLKAIWQAVFYFEDEDENIDFQIDIDNAVRGC